MVVSFVGEIVYCVDTRINVGESQFLIYMIPAH